MTASEVVAVLARHRFLVTTEADLQRSIAAVLDGAGVAYEREARLSARDRVDFLVGTVGVEVKTQGSWRDVDRQLRRYAKSPHVDALVLVTLKARHAAVTRTMGDVPVHVHTVAAGL